MSRRETLKHMIHIFRNSDLLITSSMPMKGRSLKPLQPYSIYSTLATVRSFDKCVDIDTSISHAHKEDVPTISLAKSLACLPEEPFVPVDKVCATRMELKRLIEIRIKKRVKEQYTNGKFQNLFTKVVATPKTLQDAYDSIRLSSNIDLLLAPDNFCFATMAEQLGSGNFDVKENTYSLSSRTKAKEILVLPNMKLKVVQEAIRIVLEVVYRPYFSKISHGCRSGRGHNSALRYICKEIRNPDWLFTLPMNQKVDTSVLTKLISCMEENIEDKDLSSMLHKMLDADVLNFVFGGFPKGQGIPQEGVLSPILMNIYLDLFDKELYRISMKNEALVSNANNFKEANKHSKLRSWFRRQMKEGNGNSEENSGLRIWACRYMDEILIAVSGSKDVALELKADIHNFMKNILFIDVDGKANIVPMDSSHGIQFLGMLLKVKAVERSKERAIHKLKDKVRLFSLQKKDQWDVGTLRIGKKWLAHGLKKIKESEIKHLADQNSVLNKICQFRKDGMKTDHWFKFLLKTWLQNSQVGNNVEEVLSKYIAEPALPEDLRDSFYKFQKCAHEYILSETASTDALLYSSSSNASSSSATQYAKTKIFAPINYIKKSLLRYGLVNGNGFPQRVSSLILLDNTQIINWFSGLIRRWLKWYIECENFGDIKIIIVEYLRKSCIRTLASKHRIHEIIIEKKFESELSRMPSAHEMEIDMMAMKSDLHLFAEDEALMYGISNTGLCLLSLARLSNPSRPCQCHIMGCCTPAPGTYSIHVNERQRFPGWKTGFTTAIHPGLNRRRIGLCKKHAEDLCMGHISLQSVDFGASRR